MLTDDIIECLAETFDIEAEDLDDSVSQEDINEWDSLGAVKLVLALEAEFNVSITPEVARKMISYSTIKEQLKILKG